MGMMQAQLRRLLADVGIISRNTLRFPRAEDVNSTGQADSVRQVYRKLSGVLPCPQLNLRAWDIEFDGRAVELDEYLHFNRYRALTLEAPIYAKLAKFPLTLYRGFCSTYEGRCLQAGGYGGKWSNRSCEAQFGVSSSPKDLSGNGSSRWKQRAFYDFVKDLSPLVVGVAVARISIWDEVFESGQKRTVAEVLSRPNERTSGRALAQLVHERAA
jgi:hypothetical protein